MTTTAPPAGTIYLVTWSRGYHDDREQGVECWCATEREARVVIAEREAWHGELVAWSREWFEANPRPREAHYNDSKEDKTAATERWYAWSCRLETALAERFGGKWYSHSLYQHEPYGLNPTTHYDVEEVRQEVRP